MTPDLSLKLPDTFSPTVQILQILTISVGLPYFILSITSTLLQKWYSNVNHKKTPYSLYSISNAGSLLGIIAYPFLVEPLLPIKNQANFWSVLFILYSILIVLATILIIKSNKKIKKTSAATVRLILSKVPRRTAFAWLALPAVSSIMLSSSSNQLTQTIAPIPFLWLLPLGIYLFSFILCFDPRLKYMKLFYACGFLIYIPII